MTTRNRWRALLAVSVLLMSLVVIREAPVPFAWIGFLWAAALLLAAWKAPAWGALSWNLAVACLLLGLAELHLHRRAAGHVVRDVVVDNQGGNRRAIHDDVLGYRPIENRTVSWRQHRGDRLVFDVTYTIDDRGLRVAPPFEGTPPGECVFFFGGSFTFGHGVDDSEALPYQTGVKTDGRYRVYNFSYVGYGPHQMLAALENGLTSFPECTPRHAIYQGIVSHVKRVSGQQSWGVAGPRYVLDGEDVVGTGSFDQNSVRGLRGILNRIGAVAQRSYLVSRVTRHTERASGEDVELTAAVIAAAAKEFEQRYPGAEFHVILWDSPGATVQSLAAKLRSRGLDLHLVSAIIPELADGREPFRLPGDQHPNALAYERIAAYLASTILVD